METFSALLAICAGNSPVTGEFPHKGQWRGALMYSLICVWINGWVNNREAGDLRRHRAHYDVTIMHSPQIQIPTNHQSIIDWYSSQSMMTSSNGNIFRVTGHLYNKNPCAWLNWPSEDQCQRSHSKWVFVFIPHLKSKYSQLIVSKLPRKSAICPRRSPWRLIVLVRSLRSARLDTAWLVKSVTYFNLIG